jgi:hypothetical protein
LESRPQRQSLDEFGMSLFFLSPDLPSTKAW